MSNAAVTFGKLTLPAIGDTLRATDITDNLKTIYTNNANTSANPPWTADGNVGNANAALSGGLWYDTTNSKLNVYNSSTNLWNSIGMEVSDVAPSSPTNGTLWYDTKNKYIKFYSNEAVTTIAVSTSLSAASYMIVALGTTTQAEWNTLAGTTGQTYAAGSTFTVGSPSTALTTTGTVATTALASTINAAAVTAGNSYIIASLGTTDWNTIAGTTGLTYVVGQLITAKAAGTGTGVVVQTSSSWQPYGTIVQPLAPVVTNALGTNNANANVGTMWYDTSASKLKVYSGTAWSGVGGGATISDSAPTAGLSDGDLWYDSSSNYRLYIYSSDAQAWIDASPAAANTATMDTGKVAATAGQTAFTATALGLTAFASGSTVVYLNGIKLVETTDYSINYTTNTITLVAAAVLDDELSVIVFKSFAIANAASTGSPTFTGLVKGTVTVETGLTINMNTDTNYIVRTPAAAETLSFTNMTDGTSGFILLINTGGWAISVQSASVKCDTSFASTISTTGRYLISYFCYGGFAHVVTSGALV